MRTPDLGSLLLRMVFPNAAIPGKEQLPQIFHSPGKICAALRNFIAGPLFPHIEVPEIVKTFESTPSSKRSVPKHAAVEDNRHPLVEGVLKLNPHLALLKDANGADD